MLLQAIARDTCMYASIVIMAYKLFALNNSSYYYCNEKFSSYSPQIFNSIVSIVYIIQFYAWSQTYYRELTSMDDCTSILDCRNLALCPLLHIFIDGRYHTTWFSC